MDERMNSGGIKYVSECFIKPKYEVEESTEPYYLSPYGLTFLPVQYIQSGLLFHKPQLNTLDLHNLLQTLKHSLSLTLVHFYPLAGRLATRVDETRHRCLVYVDCNKGPGAKFIYATLDVTVSDIVSGTYVNPCVVESFFDHNGVNGHGGHTRPLVSVQVTGLLDGIFVGVSMNHTVADGAAFWHFWNVWSDIHEATPIDGSVLNPPVHDFNLLPGCGPEIWFPFPRLEELIAKRVRQQLVVRIFHFSSDSIKMLKEKANEENGDNCKISSFQALTALVWRSAVRANHQFLSHDEVTKCGLSINNRPRLDPPLPPHYFRSSMEVVRASATVGELLGHSLGWAASLVHQSVANHTDKVVRESLKEWCQSPHLYQRGPISVMMTMSPRFEIYRNKFGVLGKPVVVRNGINNTFPGTVVAYPGRDGGASVDLEIHLLPDTMKALESDQQFMSVAS